VHDFPKRRTLIRSQEHILIFPPLRHQPPADVFAAALPAAPPLSRIKIDLRKSSSNRLGPFISTSRAISLSAAWFLFSSSST
jgi:hypothetical protein